MPGWGITLAGLVSIQAMLSADPERRSVSMPMPVARLERAPLLLFVASGFAGLVYQGIW
jgi:hypothetical protein